jgi:hypothetical protein
LSFEFFESLEVHEGKFEAVELRVWLGRRDTDLSDLHLWRYNREWNLVFRPIVFSSEPSDLNLLLSFFLTLGRFNIHLESIGQEKVS